MLTERPTLSQDQVDGSGYGEVEVRCAMKWEQEQKLNPCCTRPKTARGFLGPDSVEAPPPLK